MTDPETGSTRRPDRRAVMAAAAGAPLLASGAEAAAADPAPDPAGAPAAHLRAGGSRRHRRADRPRHRRRRAQAAGADHWRYLVGDDPAGRPRRADIGPDGTTRVLARYTLQTDDGTLIGITNPGIRRGPPDVIRRLSAGEAVDPSLYYFRTTPSFAVADGPHAWLGQSIFVGIGIRRAGEVEIRYFALG